MIFNAILIAYVTLLILGFSDNIRGPLFSELQKQFHLNNTEGSLIFAVSSVVALACSLLAPRILKKITHKQLMQWALLCMAVGLFGISISESYVFVLFSAVFFGASLGFLGVCQNAMVASGTDQHHRKRWMSGLHLMYAVASFAAPVAVSLALELTWGWRDIFRWTSLIPFLCIFLLQIVFVPDFRGDTSNSLKLKTMDRPSHPHIQRKSHHPSWLLYVAGLGFACYVLAEIMVSTRLALYYSQELHESVSSASRKVSQFFLFMLAGRLLFTLVQFRWQLIYQLSVSLGLSGLCLVIGLLFEPSFLALSGLFMAPFYGLGMTYITQVFDAKKDHAIAVVVSMQSLFVVLMHLGVGLLTDFLTLKKALWVGPMSLSLCLILLGIVHAKHESH